MRQPDIEIYLRDASQEAVTNWLGEAIAPCTAWQQKGQTYKCHAGEIPVVWLPKAVGKWHCLLLDSNATPWQDDLECARAAYQALAVEIRCAPGGWEEEEAIEVADRWISISERGEEEIVWRTG